MVHSWCLGETRERGEGTPRGGEEIEGRGLVAVVEGDFAAMATDGGGSKQMSTSWQSGPEWPNHYERQVDIQKHSGTAEKA